MINTDALYNTFIYFFTGYGVMACTVNLFNLLNKTNKVNEDTKIVINEDTEIVINEDTEIVINKDTIVENFEYVKLRKRKKII